MPFGRLSIVLSTHAARFEAVAFKGDLEANLTRIARWGYTGVELAIRDPGLVDADHLEALLEDLGLKLCAIGTGQAWSEERLSFTDPDRAVRTAAITRIKSQIDLAHRFNALVIIGLIRGITPAGQSKNQSMSYLVGCLQECAAKALEQGVHLALEPLNRYETDLVHTVSQGLQLIEEVGYTNLGLLLDTFHMNIEEPDIVESLQVAGEKIFHFHVADSNRWYPGAGHLDFVLILKTLKSMGYPGWISGEFMPLPDADTAACRNIEFLRRSLPPLP
jgi:sugar phosphate isomerase/epimerase